MSPLRFIVALGFVLPLLWPEGEERHAGAASSQDSTSSVAHDRGDVGDAPDDTRVPAGGVSADCRAKGKRLYGRVKVVDAFADLTVRKVDAFADLRVKRVDAFADECGEWMFVDAFPDFTIRYVDAFADVTIKQVDAFPGLP